MYILNQFEAFKQGDFITKTFIDETQEEEKEQIYFETTINDIKHKNILTKFIHRDYDRDNGINSRVFFIHPEKQMYLLYFDSEITIGSNSLDELKPLFNKYEQYIGIKRKQSFLEQK